MILGGGVAGLEALVALDDLARDRVSVTLVSASPDFTYRPLTVAEPFSLGHAEHHPLQRVADDFGARLVVDSCEEVIPDDEESADRARTAWVSTGRCPQGKMTGR